LKIKTLKIIRKKNIPNAITFIRIILIFPIITLLELNLQNHVYFLIILGGISDFADGFIAKRYKLKSNFGTIIDPLADKIFVLILFTWLSINQIIPYWSFSIILIREFFITSFRNSKKEGMPAINIAKYKSFFQFLALILLFYPSKNTLIFDTGLISYWISFALCIYSSIIYLRPK
tara:strand:+ start:279 stop:806 length:528 start_codon:yes stop_codon:yes gene_type:complete